MSNSSSAWQRQLRTGELIRHALAGIFLRGETGDPDLEPSCPRLLSVLIQGVFAICAALVIPTPARAADDGYFVVNVLGIEAFLIDRSTGALSDNIVGAGRSVFISSGSVNDTKTKPADDVLVRVHLQADRNQAFQPPVSVVVLAHLDSVAPAGEFINVVKWIDRDDLKFDGRNNEETVTLYLSDVTCSNLDIVVRASAMASAVLPFECRK